MTDNNENKKPPKNPKGSGPNKPDDNFDWSKVLKMVFGWGAVIVAAIIVMQVSEPHKNSKLIFHLLNTADF